MSTASLITLVPTRICVIVIGAFSTSTLPAITSLPTITKSWVNVGTSTVGFCVLTAFPARL